MAKKYTVTDGKLVLTLEPAEKGWYAVTSPFDPGLTTQAKSLEEAFVMAYDALKCLRAARAKLARRSGPSSAPKGRQSVAQGASPGNQGRDKYLSLQTRRSDRNVQPSDVSVAPPGLKRFNLTTY